ncbi:hypothetical protein [Tindallia californiensis]|uniref:Transposase DDE domain-containing protein n=1 Tax=Tindallia californiensis TaxID=159292 RepID=A0A1H3QC52_9FIRM|nr:hypothetical protein [Tindallia californiensis]SDZ11124.1 hypothetical protein SAMN05192546_1094 [Tindallia californiensis]
MIAYKDRTGVEQMNKRLKCDYSLEDKKRRSSRDQFFEGVLTASC